MGFRRRYNLARYTVGLLFAVLILFATSTSYSFEVFLGLIFAFAVIGWLLTVRGLRCPHCGDPAVSRDFEGERSLPLLGDPPTRCAACGQSLD